MKLIRSDAQFNFRGILSVLYLLLIISLTIFVLSQIYEDKVPKIVEEFNNGAIGAILTAIITSLIIGMQSSSQERFQKQLLELQAETEERQQYNVRVFDERVKRYNAFIEKLWSVWEDKVVTLEEVYDLTNLFAKDILMFTNQGSTKQILKHIDGIAEIARSGAVDTPSQSVVQEHIFEIVNILAQEINLGGKTDPEDRRTIASIDDKIRPFIKAKQYRAAFQREFNEAIEEAGIDRLLPAAEIREKGGEEFIWLPIEDSPVHIVIGPIKQKTPINHNFMAFHVDIQFEAFHQLRDKQRGWKKYYLLGYLWNRAPKIDFNDPKQLLVAMAASGETPLGRRWAGAVIDFYKTWKSPAGLSIEQEIIGRTAVG